MSPIEGPNFICIGAQKAGTTWLWEILREHPSVWLPPIKELHWFDIQSPPSELNGAFTFRHRRGWRRYTPLLRRGAWRDAAWIYRFYRSLGRNEPYRSLFRGRHGRTCGEITPAYSILDAKTVESIRLQVSTDCRIILILREPAQRLWSGIRMHCRKRAIDLDTLTTQDIDEIARRPEHALRTDYSRTLRNWSGFGEKLGVFFFEDLAQDPQSFLADVLKFLQLEPNWTPLGIDTVSNPGGDNRPLPPDLARLWIERYARTVEDVRRHVGRVPQSWTSPNPNT